MGNAYYKPAKKEILVEPTIIPLPKLDGPLEFNSSRFVNARETMRLRSNKDIETEPCLSVYLGKAIDGLPLAFKIHRSYSIQQTVLTSLGISKLEDLPPTLKDALVALEDAVQIKSCETGIKADDATGVKFYQSYNGVGTLLETTILAKILNDRTVSALNERGEGYLEALKDKSTTMHMGVPINKDARSIVENLRRVIGVEEGSKDFPYGNVISIKQYEEQVMLDRLYLESLGPYLPNIKFRAFPDRNLKSRDGKPLHVVPNSAYEGLLTDRDAYLQALSLSTSVELLIPIGDLISNVVLPLARALHQSMHSQGRVHGDVKPSNILLLETGPVLIDARGCDVGSIAGIYTPKWCPPEQILGKPVAAGSDVFSLGMLLLSFLRGEAWGELRMFRMPGTSEKIEVLDMEGIWLDPKIWKEDSIRRAWTDALVRFLNFKVEERPENAGKFADELEALLKIGKLPEIRPLSLTLPLHAAKLYRFDINENNADNRLKETGGSVSCGCAPVWVIEDCYPTLK
eukprot:TRINITY_DN1722_c0_g1_i1.p1 TRINITY_DN1722_c0_g1~~TRINITY_DN1722_c0_g1_i1.p1  ORF type:complete len:516 (-),score=162.93 TRINITY_DN1722_c0_g1_i1:42-1589(-)